MSAFDLLTLACGIGSGVIAGVFFAFSVSVMKALGAIRPACGIAAMQSINVVIINPWFMSAFIGTAGLCLLVVAMSIMRWDEAGIWAAVSGSVLYGRLRESQAVSVYSP